MKDWNKKSARSKELSFLSRSLAAFSIINLANTNIEVAAEAIVDGGKDNGVDAIFYDEQTSALYLVQSKWKQDGSGSFSKGDVQKFLRGVKDLMRERFEKFNKKVQRKADVVDRALNNSNIKIMLVLAYTGKERISDDVKQDLNDFLSEENDIIDSVFLQILDQKHFHNAISQDSQGSPINIEVMLYDWGQTKEPFQSFYGQVCVADLVGWWEEHNTNLFTPNIRTYLGKTGVNSGIIETLKTSPDKFWYYNNGVTALTSSIKKKALGGSSRDSGIFECKDIRIVNGAQTVGSASQAFTLYPELVQQAKVFIRFISLENCPEDFDREVTRFNNTQNKIDSRDFISLDPEQERIRNELRLEDITYVYKSGDLVLSKETGFEIEEAAIARACSFDNWRYVVQAKGKISKLWNDIEKAPYKALFNGGVTGPYLWRTVQIMRIINQELDRWEPQLKKNKEHLYLVHGNLFIAHIVFRLIPDSLSNKLGMLEAREVKIIEKKTIAVFEQVVSSARTLFPDVYAGNLFKNLRKCEALFAFIENKMDFKK